MSTSPHRTGAVRATHGGRSRRRAGILKWLLPLLLLAIAAAIVLALVLGDDDSGSGGGAASGNGSLSADGSALLPVPGGGLGSFAGKQATGEGLRVQSIVEGEGLWVGTSKSDPVYVEYGGRTGENEANDLKVAVGDRVDLTGPVRPAPQDPATALHLDSADAKLVAREKGFINANRVSRAD